MSVTTLKTENHKVELQFHVHDETKFDDYIQRIVKSAKLRQNHINFYQCDVDVTYNEKRTRAVADFRVKTFPAVPHVYVNNVLLDISKKNKTYNPITGSVEKISTPLRNQKMYYSNDL